VEDTNVTIYFPIKDDALYIVNQNINSCAKDSYLSLFFLDVNILMKCSMRSLLLPEGVLKNLRRVHTDEFAVGIKVKGLFGKKPLTYKHISMVHFKIGYFYTRY